MVIQMVNDMILIIIQAIGQEIADKSSLLERVDVLADEAIQGLDEFHSSQIHQSLETLHQLRNDVLLHHRQVLDELLKQQV